MKTDKAKKGGLFGKFRAKLSGEKVVEAAGQEQTGDKEVQQMIEDFDAVKRYPGHLTGWDFDRAFDFIERYPDAPQVEILTGQMYSTTGPSLKGLSYASAVKVLERMPDFAGSESIVKGMHSLESDYVKELKSDVIAYMLKIIPDHPLEDELTTALAVKNLASAYDFITANPDNVCTKKIIKAMFDWDANIAVLLLQEKMDHPQVDSIFTGIYNILKDADIRKLTPNAIIFILDVAPDHPKAERMIQVLVENNYVKAYDFVKMHPDHALVEVVKRLILVRKPELKELLGEIG
jgi:hypothetical protein